MSQTSPATGYTPEEGVEPDGLDTPTIVMWGFVSVVLVVSVMLGAAALFYGAQSKLNEERIVAPKYANSEDVVIAQQGVLASYAPPASEGKPYRIPIDVAEKLVLDELKSGE